MGRSVIDILPRQPSTDLPDTDIGELDGESQRNVYEAVGGLLIAMIESTGGVYADEFVVRLETGEQVAFEPGIEAGAPVSVLMN